MVSRRFLIGGAHNSMVHIPKHCNMIPSPRRTSMISAPKLGPAHSASGWSMIWRKLNTPRRASGWILWGTWRAMRGEPCSGLYLCHALYAIIGLSIIEANQSPSTEFQHLQRIFVWWLLNNLRSYTIALVHTYQLQRSLGFGLGFR